MSLLKKVVISGWYGNGNLGDELILRGILLELGKLEVGLPVVVFSDDPASTQSEHGVASCKRPGSRRLDHVRRLLQLAGSNIIILGGGTLLKDYRKHSKEAFSEVFMWLRDLKVAQTLGIPTATFATGVGQIWERRSKEEISEVLNRVNLLSVREEYSATRLRELGVAKEILVIPDPAMLYALQFKDAVKKSNNLRIAVSLRHWYKSGNYIEDPLAFESMKSVIAKAFDLLVREHNAELIFIPMRTADPRDDDRLVIMDVMRRMKTRKNIFFVDKRPSPEGFINLLGQADMVVGMRLHSLVVGAALGVPVIGINYDDKVLHFMDSIGQGRFVVPPNLIDSELMLDFILKAIYEHAKISTKISERVQGMLSNEKRYVKMLRELMLQNSVRATLRHLPNIFSSLIRVVRSG